MEENFQNFLIKFRNLFLKTTIEHFSYLTTEYDFKLVEKKVTSGYTRIIYKNNTTAVKIMLEWRDQYIYLELCKLIDGNLISNPIIIRVNDDITCVNFEDILQILSPNSLPISNPQKALTEVSVKEILAAYANALKDRANGVLRGIKERINKLS